MIVIIYIQSCIFIKIIRSIFSIVLPKFNDIIRNSHVVYLTKYFEVIREFMDCILMWSMSVNV